MSMLQSKHRQEKEIRRTVEAGRYVGLAAITSKVRWAPERETKKSQREERRERGSELIPIKFSPVPTGISGVVC